MPHVASASMGVQSIRQSHAIFLALTNYLQCTGPEFDRHCRGLVHV